MKLLYFLGFIALTSCVTSESIVYQNDNFKSVETLNLRLTKLLGYSTLRNGVLFGPDYEFSSTFLHTRPISSDNVTTINLSIKTGISQKKLNPELYIVTDRDTIQITNGNYYENSYTITSTTKEENTSSENNTSNEKTTTTNTTTSPIQLMECTYKIDADCARKIAYSERIIFRVYIGDSGIDIKPDLFQREKIAYFFKKSLVASGYLGKTSASR